MGWLRALMDRAEPRVRSFDLLAERLRSHPDWPVEVKAQTRSLGALLSKLDRGIELEWLAERALVQHVAAEVLGCPLASIQQAVGAALHERAATQELFRFDDVPFAKPLNLRGEPLPPGLPVRVQRPASWQRLWWHAPSGSGRSLVGSWLGARGLARHAVVHDAQQAARLLADAGEPLFLEITGPTDQLPVPAPGLRCCIASSETPRGGPWEVVRAPAAGAILAELFAWLQRRLPKDGNFAAEPARAWVEAAVPAALLDSFGVALGLAGLIDALGLQQLAGKSLEMPACAFVRERLLAAGERGSQEAQWLGERGFEALLGMARRALTESRLPWAAPRSESDWIALVPHDLQQSVDASWAKHALAGALSRPAARELERALATLQPGAFRVVRALKGAGILRETQQDGQLQIGPQWLLRLLEETAFAQVMDGAVSEWGDALLLPHTAPRVFSALCQKLVGDEVSTLEDALELEVGANPAHAAALEAGFRAAGLASLQGAQLSAELLTALYEEQRELMLDIPGQLPMPRIDHAQGRGELEMGFFYLAAWAVSAQLPERGLPRHPVLHPFGERAADPRLSVALSRIASAVGPDGDGRWLVPACLLVERLLEHFEPAGRDSLLGGAGAPHELLWASLLVREAEQGAVDGQWLERLAERPHTLLAVQALCTQRRAKWRDIAAKLWRAWQVAHRTTSPLSLFCRHGQALWPHAPVELLAPALQSALRAGLPVPYEALSEEQWQALSEPLPQSAAAALADPSLWRHVPFAIALPWLGHSTAWPHLGLALPLLWQRDAAAMLAHYELQLKAVRSAEQGVTLASWLTTTPPEHRAELLPVLRAAATRPGAPIVLVDATRGLLHAQVAARGPSWRDAYELLVELERRARRVR